MTMKHCILFFCIVVVFVAQPVRSEVVMPNFDIVGQKGEHVGELWKNNATNHVLPKQLAVDFTNQGVVYGFVCEYWWNQNVFDEIKAKLENSIKAKQKAPSKNYFVWRAEDQKLAISLFLDKESNTIKLIAVSTDATIRGKSTVKANEKAK